MLFSLQDLLAHPNVIFYQSLRVVWNVRVNLSRCAIALDSIFRNQIQRPDMENSHEIYLLKVPKDLLTEKIEEIASNEFF